MIRVAIAVRSRVLRTALETMVRGEPELELVETNAAGRDIAGPAADVVISSEAELDFHELEEGSSGPAVVLMVEDPEPGFIAEALRAGVRAVLTADAGPAELAGAIHAAASGLSAIRPADLETVLAVPARTEPPHDGTPELTPRELEVLQMLAEGLANKQIAWQLGISEHTAKAHVAGILTKLNAGSRAQAVTIGIRRGLILI